MAYCFPMFIGVICEHKRMLKADKKKKIAAAVEPWLARGRRASRIRISKTFAIEYSDEKLIPVASARNTKISFSYPILTSASSHGAV